MIDISKNVLFKNIHQIGIVTSDIRQALKKYIKYYGMGPWNLWEFGPEMVEDMQVKGIRKDYRMLVATCKKMNIDFELIQPLDKKSIYFDFLSEHGEGIQHLNYDAYDYDSLIETFKSKNILITQFGNLVGKHRYVYFDTFKDAGHIIETSGNLPGFKRREPLEQYPVMKEEEKENNHGLKNISQIGILVMELHNTVRALNDKYLIGPWKFYRTDDALEVAASILNGVELILLGHEYGDTFTRFTGKISQGPVYVSFEVDDYSKSLESFKRRDIHILENFDLGVGKYTFLNTHEDLKFISCIYNPEWRSEKVKPYDQYPKNEH